MGRELFPGYRCWKLKLGNAIPLTFWKNAVGEGDKGSSSCKGWRGKEDVSHSVTLSTEELKIKPWKVIYIAYMKFVPLRLLSCLKKHCTASQYVQILLLTPHGKYCCYTGLYFFSAVFVCYSIEWLFWWPTSLICHFVALKKCEERENLALQETQVFFFFS